MIAAKPSIRILDCTLRDGSYAIDFRFTAADTELIAGALDRISVPLIEIGHGVGLHASESGMGEAAETDAGYLNAARRVVRRGKYGMFCIPGVARLEDVDLAADLGAGFLRIGTNVAEAANAEPFILRAKRRGLEVMANFMKSYTMAPREFAQTVLLAEGFGADAVYIVDSAGGMMPEDLTAYMDAVREVTRVPIGFHGHDNLGLAVAHSLRAVEMGAAVVDGSLKGMGRSSGNAPTELLIAALSRMGIDTGIDLIEVLDAAEQYVEPFLSSDRFLPLDVIAGYALFHSSFMGTILQYAGRYRIDPRRLILAVCEEDRVNAPEDLVNRIAERLGEAGGSFSRGILSGRYGRQPYFGKEQG